MGRPRRKNGHGTFASEDALILGSFTYARGLHKALDRLGIDRLSWHESAQDRGQWRTMINPQLTTPPAPPAP